MPFPWANTLLLTLIVAQLTSGFFGLTNGQEARAWLLWTHGIGAYALVLLLFYKGAVVFNALARRRRLALERALYLVLVAALLFTIVSGVAWTFAGRRIIAGFSLITLHVIVALSLTLPLALHVGRMRFVFRLGKARDRRAALRLGALAVAGAALWRFAGLVRERLNLPGAQRRFTGSYETGSLGGEFPYVVWLADFHPPVEVTTWRLRVEGEVERPLSFAYDDLRGLVADQVQTVIDCTGGWYSLQTWQGVNVGRLLAQAGPRPAAQSVSFETDSGYGRRFAIDEARTFLLALGVGERPLDHGHGFPARLVAPDHRGFTWVKWVTRVQVHTTPAWLQPPVPLR